MNRVFSRRTRLIGTSYCRATFQTWCPYLSRIVISAHLLLIPTLSLIGHKTAHADEPVSCCEDLAERISELELKAAQNEVRKTSVTISGQVNETVYAFDDGGERNVYTGANIASGPRFRIIGKSKIAPGWDAGFRISLNVWNAPTFSVNQVDDDADPFNLGSIFLRRLYLYIESRELGSISVGRTGPALDNLIFGYTSKIFSSSSADVLMGTNLSFRNSQTGELTGITPVTLTGFLFTFRRNTIVYKSPDIHGLTLRAAFAEDDFWGAAAYYKQTLGDFDVMARVGYSQDSDGTNGTGTAPNFEEFKAALSVLHQPTGLFVDSAYIHRTTEPTPDGTSLEDVNFSYLRLGWQASLNQLGKTSFYGEYAISDGGLEGGDTPGYTSSIGITEDITRTELRRWGFGILQKVDAAATDLYVGYHKFEADVETVAGALPTDPIQILYSGALIRF